MSILKVKQNYQNKKKKYYLKQLMIYIKVVLLIMIIYKLKNLILKIKILVIQNQKKFLDKNGMYLKNFKKVKYNNYQNNLKKFLKKKLLKCFHKKLMFIYMMQYN